MEEKQHLILAPFTRYLGTLGTNTTLGTLPYLRYGKFHVPLYSAQGSAFRTRARHINY